jgi:hypothetical protein
MLTQNASASCSLPLFFTDAAAIAAPRWGSGEATVARMAYRLADIDDRIDIDRQLRDGWLSRDGANARSSKVGELAVVWDMSSRLECWRPNESCFTFLTPTWMN